MINQYSFYIGLFFCLAYGVCGNAASPADTAPMGNGPYPVASTNMEVAPEYVGIDKKAMDKYLKGHKTEQGHQQYLSDILKHPQSTLITHVQIPDDPNLYGRASGTTLPVVTYLVYPAAKNQHQKRTYTFPSDGAKGITFEGMLAAGETPSFADSEERYPLLIVAHGFRAHGVHSNYLEMAHGLASHGYIVAVPSFGDIRTYEENSDFFVVANLRPLLTKAVIDSVLDSKTFGSHIDTDNIGMFGRSLGGLSTLALGGGPIRNLATVSDPRIKVGVLSVPWVGGKNDEGEEFLAFGTDNSGLARVSIPILAFIGTNDEIAKPSYTLPALKQLSGPTYVIELINETHNLVKDSRLDRNNWQLLFLSAYLKNDKESLNKLQSAHSMAGGNKDLQLFDYQKVNAKQ